MVKGFALNNEQFKTGNSMNYFNELQDRLREIRIYERFLAFFIVILRSKTTRNFIGQTIKDFSLCSK